MADFHEKLASYIAAHPEWNEASLATAAGLDNSSIRKMLKLRQSPRLDTIEKICAVTGEPIETFISDTRPEYLAEIARLFALLTPQEQEILKGVANSILAQHQKAG